MAKSKKSAEDGAAETPVFAKGDAVILTSCGLPGRVVDMAPRADGVAEYKIAGQTRNGAAFECWETADRLSAQPEERQANG